MIIRKYTCNSDYFKEINTSDKAYWLGFLYTDGCILETRNKTANKLKTYILELSLKSTDKSHLIKFLDSVGSNSPIADKKIKLNGNTYYACRVNICNTELCRDLIRHGCTPRKSLILTFPSDEIVPKELK